MRVLAVRNNSLFWKAPIVFLVCTAVICFAGYLYTPQNEEIPEGIGAVVFYYMMGITEPHRSVRRFLLSVATVAFGSLFYAFSVLFHKNVIIECDDCGIYIYRLFQPIKTIRYEEFWSQSSREDFDEVYVMRRHTVRWWRTENYYRITDPFFDFIKTGTLRIETPYEVLNIGGIKNVKQVEIELNKIIRDKKREYLDEMNEKILVQNRMEELAQLSKHDPNT